MKKWTIVGVVIFLVGFGLHRPQAIDTNPKINVYDLWRDTNKLRPTKPLLLDQALNETAQAKCDDEVTHNYYDHADWTKFVLPLGRHHYGENLIYQRPTSQKVVDDWRSSPGHYKNIVDYGFSRVGFGICNFRGSQLVVQHFSD